MKCNYCGKEIDTTDKRVHYCSDECRHQAYLKQLKVSNHKRRTTNPEYRKRTYARNLQRYYDKKHESYEAIAKSLQKHAGDIEAMVKILEEKCRLRH